MRRIHRSAGAWLDALAQAWFVPLLITAWLAGMAPGAHGATTQDPPFPPDSTAVPPGGEEEEGLGPTPDEPMTTSEPSDTVETAAPDTTGTAAPDTSATAFVKPGTEAPLDTLSLPGTVPKPSSSGPSTGSPGSPSAGAAPPPKPRTGFLGIHPAAILIGLAALNYFIIKAATD